MNVNFSFINLWCTKNLVDTQYLIGKLLTSQPKNHNKVYKYVNDPFSPEVKEVYINTCWFISSWREEAKYTIKKLLKKGKKIIAFWCAVEYFKNVAKEKNGLENNFSEQEKNNLSTLSRKEISSNIRLYTNAHQKFEYLKIAEWCDNNCSFCIIPKIRGKQKSLPKEEIITEIHNMLDAGIEEIIIIAQDTTRYWTDIYGKPILFELLQEIDKIKWNFKFRLLYLYPDILTLEHLSKLTKLKKFIPYFDVPLQHISAPLLKKMWRFYDEEAVYKFLDFIKNNFKNSYIRTNIIIGFPWETDEDQQKLIWFLNKDYFDNIALFEYHDEPYAASSKLPNKVDDQTLKTRFIQTDDIVDKLLSKKEKQRKWTEETGYIMDIKQKKNQKLSTQNLTQLEIRPEINCPEIDSYDTITLDQVTWVEDNKTSLEIGDKISYIV